MKHITLRTTRVSTALLKRLEAAGIIVTLIIASSAGAQGLERGDLKSAVRASEAELIRIAESDPDAFDLQNMRETGIVRYMCETDAEYSTELTAACERAAELKTARK